MPIVQQDKRKQFNIAIPKEIAKLLELKKGDELKFFVDFSSGMIALKKVVNHERKKGC
jgi:AbrB family looped-hinge helix DNA binding protein